MRAHTRRLCSGEKLVSMKVIPYGGVDGISFGMDAAQVVSFLGAPIRSGVTRKGRTKLDYRNHTVFLVDARVVEVSADSPVVDLLGVTVPFQHLETFLKDSDAAAFEALGITISPAFGMTVDPFCPNWFCAFGKEELDAWMRYAPGQTQEQAQE